MGEVERGNEEERERKEGEEVWSQCVGWMVMVVMW